jgi:hypothetical protein
MQVIHLGQKELAERWRMSEATLERWRSDRISPVFLKIRGRVLYRHVKPRNPSATHSGFVRHLSRAIDACALSSR